MDKKEKRKQVSFVSAPRSYNYRPHEAHGSRATVDAVRDSLAGERAREPRAAAQYSPTVAREPKSSRIYARGAEPERDTRDSSYSCTGIYIFTCAARILVADQTLLRRVPRDNGSGDTLLLSPYLFITTCSFFCKKKSNIKKN